MTAWLWRVFGFLLRRWCGGQTFEGLDWGSPTLRGPIAGVGDCVFAGPECAVMFWVDEALPARPGDLVNWFMPSQRPGEQQATKWLIDVDGVEWLCCKYFATRRTKGWHVPAGRVVALLRSPQLVNEADPRLSERLAREMRELRANPPRRPDVVVFERDLIDHEEIRAAIRARREAAQRLVDAENYRAAQLSWARSP